MMKSNPITFPKEHGSEKFERPLLKQKQDISVSWYYKVDTFNSQSPGRKPKHIHSRATEKLIKGLFSMVPADVKETNEGWNSHIELATVGTLGHPLTCLKRQSSKAVPETQKQQLLREGHVAWGTRVTGGETQPPCNNLTEREHRTLTSTCSLWSPTQVPQWQNPAGHQRTGKLSDTVLMGQPPWGTKQGGEGWRRLEKGK